jgi:hypothetical protein
MQASRKPRRAFAAAFVAIAAAPACVVTPSNSDPAQPKQPPPKAEDHRTPHTNPPAVPDYERSWNVEMQDDGSCLAFGIVECGKGAVCNPPAPQEVECPVGIALGTRVKIHAAAGSLDCYTMPEGGTCPENATCNPPPPRQTACPK